MLLLCECDGDSPNPAARIGDLDGDVPLLADHIEGLRNLDLGLLPFEIVVDEADAVTTRKIPTMKVTTVPAFSCTPLVKPYARSAAAWTVHINALQIGEVIASDISTG